MRHSDDDQSFEDGRSSRRKGYRKTVRERPGLAPGALFHLIGNSVFLRLSDVASGLPPYEERVLLSSMDREPDHTGLSQRKAYDVIFDTLRQALAAALAKGSKRLLATYLQTLLAYPDGCTRGETVFDPQTGNILVQAPPLSEDKLYPKERQLVDLVAAEMFRSQGLRGVLKRWVNPVMADSLRLVLHSTMALASLSLETTVASSSGTKSAVMRAPPMVRMSLVQIWSSTPTGMPCIRPQ